MAQIQGNQIADGGRLDASVGTALATGSVAIGAGWGGTATKSIRSGSNDQAGVITITASATTPAQATATVAITFTDGAYASTPRSYNITLLSSSNAAAEPTALETTPRSATGRSETSSEHGVQTGRYRRHFGGRPNGAPGEP